MSKIVSVLEQLGQNAQLRNAQTDHLDLALAHMQIDSADRNLILARDVDGLAAAIGATAPRCCMLAPKKDKEQDDAPSRDDDEIQSSVANRCVAA